MKFLEIFQNHGMMAMFISLKEAAFEPSSPMCHMVELESILSGQSDQLHVLLLYTDGGPNHRVKYVSVQLAQHHVSRGEI